jgi:hypothetical protein
MYLSCNAALFALISGGGNWQTYDIWLRPSRRIEGQHYFALSRLPRYIVPYQMGQYGPLDRMGAVHGRPA